DFVAASGIPVAAADFGSFQDAGIQGRLFEDKNASGLIDPGEPALAGWVVFLDGNRNGIPDGTEPQVTTDASGSYAFGGLGPGTYAIQQVLKPGYSAETATRTVNVQSGVTTTGVDLADLQVASISGTVFQDTNGDGVRQSGEAGIPGITVFL